jgi:hypothetical protein
MRLIPLIVAAGCSAPIQYQGPIAIDRNGLADRFRQLCEKKVGGADRASVCAPEPLDE